MKILNAKKVGIQLALLANLRELCGKNLICWCAPDRCHAEVLIELAGRSE
jgi:hypothetical protein